MAGVILALSAAVLLALVVRSFGSASVEERAEDRRVTFETTACGDASATSGTGVIIAESTVLTAAHTVIGAGEVLVTLADGTTELGLIRYLDPRSDLAILDVGPASGSSIEFARTAAGDTVVVAAGPSGTFRTEVLRAVEVRIEEVRSTVRSSRVGYELGVNVQLGDSGSGVYDLSGRLVGIVFGRKPDGELRSFATGQSDLKEALEIDPMDIFQCDPSQHRVVSTATP